MSQSPELIENYDKYRNDHVNRMKLILKPIIINVVKPSWLYAGINVPRELTSESYYRK